MNGLDQLITRVSIQSTRVPPELAQDVVVAVSHAKGVYIEEGNVLRVRTHAGQPQHRPYILRKQCIYLSILAYGRVKRMHRP